MLERLCPWCNKLHAFETECEEQKAAHVRMKADCERRRKRDMNDAREWPPKESTIRNWEAHGLKCAVAMGTTSYCGYVHVPEGHADERKHYDDVNVEIHGGLTFRCKAKEGGSWFGFDTAHAGDWIGFAGSDLEMPGRIWTEEDVAQETEHLAQQLSERK